MKHLKYIVIALAAACMAPAQAQYVITFKDNTRVSVEGQVSFSGTGQEGTMLTTDAGNFPIADIASIEGAGVHGPIALAYHPYYSSKLPKPELTTHINYGFAEVYVRDNEYQKFKLQGSESYFKKIVALKEKKPELKILLSFSHTVVNSDNKQDGGFSAIAASDEYRKAFAQDCLDFMEKWGIDGIDLDWEFPGISWSGAACDPKVDVDNFTLLVKQMRETFGPSYLITYAGYCMDKQRTSGGWKFIDLTATEPYVDFVNLMCYDFDASPSFHNAIKSSRSYWDIDRTIKAYAKVNFPTDKMVLGIPFYVRHDWGSSTAWSQLATLDTKLYFDIDNWDDNAQVPYVTYQGSFWGSYDNPRSIAAKGVYAKEKGLRGLFYWCTYEDDTDATLARAMWQAVQDNWQE